MADDVIHCPACNFQLRLPPELAGSAVECPQCHTRFTAPVPAVRPAGDRPPPGRDYDAVAQPVGDYVHAPPAGGGGVIAAGIALLIVSLLSAGFFALMISGFAEVKKDPTEFNKAMEQAMDRNPNLGPQQRAQMQQWFSWLRDNGLAASAVQLALNLATLLGAILMIARRGYILAVLACILALNPTNCPGCILQVPFGIWGLIALLSESGRQAFR
jgi:hypothetical protein